MNRAWIAGVFFIFALLTANDVQAILILLPVGLLCALQMLRISLNEFEPKDMLWFCFFLYFFVVPVQSFNSGYFAEGGPTLGLSFEYSTYGLAALAVFLFVLLFSISEEICSKIFRLKVKAVLYPAPCFFGTGVLYLLFMFSIGSFALHVLLSGGISNVLSSRYDRNMEVVNFLAFLFLALGVVANLYILDARKNKSIQSPIYFLVVVIAFSAQALCVNLYNAPRFFLVASWLPSIFVFFREKASATKIYLLIVIGLFFVMPILSITTRFGVGGDENYDLFNLSHDIFLIKDIDVFETLVYMFEYVDKVGHQFGDNLLAIFLFFVPRDFWVDKPIVAGLRIGWDLFFLGAATTENLSFFAVGDAYMDYGWYGVFMLSIVGGCAFSFYYKKIMSGSSGYEAVLFLSMLPILIRGPLGAVIGYPLCLIFSSWFFTAVLQKNNAR